MNRFESQPEVPPGQQRLFPSLGKLRRTFSSAAHSLFSPKRAPGRTFFFSDTYGGSPDPHSAPDPDALISTDFRSRPLEDLHYKFDTYGKEKITDHLLRLIVELHRQADARSDFSRRAKRNIRDVGTGVFINAAPRIGRDNGQPFYIATVPAYNIRIVTTPLEALSPIKPLIETLHHLPNKDNGLYGNTEQFRSSYTTILLDPRHGYALEQDDTQIIPDYPDDWHIAYVDRFGNLVTHIGNPEKKWEHLTRIASGSRTRLRVLIGNAAQELTLGSSLGEAEPGELVLYGNGNLDIVSKWRPRTKAAEQKLESAYLRFEKPSIGDPISISEQE